MWLCHWAGTVACIRVLFGLKTLPDIHGPVMPISRRAGLRRAGWHGAVPPRGTRGSPSVAPGTRAPGRSQPPRRHVGLSVGAGLHRPAPLQAS